jgi:transcriptional regulator with XRE-family HTH domain
MKNHLWETIDQLMRAKNLTILTLAGKAGVTRQTLYNLRRDGKANTETVRRIAAALGVGPGYLMG